jgi:heme exporter protein D
MTRAKTHRLQFDSLMRDLTAVGFGALFVWAAVGLSGTIGGYLTVQPVATARFLLAIVVLVYARKVTFRLFEWRYRHAQPDERYGFGPGAAGSGPVRTGE